MKTKATKQDLMTRKAELINQREELWNEYVTRANEEIESLGDFKVSYISISGIVVSQVVNGAEQFGGGFSVDFVEEYDHNELTLKVKMGLGASSFVLGSDSNEEKRFEAFARCMSTFSDWNMGHTFKSILMRIRCLNAAINDVFNDLNNL